MCKSAIQISALLACGVIGSAQIHINAGGSVTGAYGADQYFTGGSSYQATIPVPAGLPDYLRTSRGGTFSYQFPVPDGNYSVVLHFIENSSAVTDRGQRVFSVTLNGNIVLPALDIWAAVGVNKEYVQTFPAIATGQGGINIKFAPSVRNAVVSAIDVIPTPIVADPFPGCKSDGNRGITCEGGINLGTTPPQTHVMFLGGGDGGAVGFAAADGPTGGGLILLVLKLTSDPTGKAMTIGGAIPCPSKLSADIIAMGPICFDVALK